MSTGPEISLVESPFIDQWVTMGWKCTTGNLVHQLVHLREANHTPEFWTRVERVLPDYQQRKDWLAGTGAGFVGL